MGRRLDRPGRPWKRPHDLFHWQREQRQGIPQGGPGDDYVTLWAPGFATAHGASGADVIDVAARDTRYGRFTIHGDAGPDTLSGGPDSDVLDGGSGADSIDAAAGSVDTIICGTGDDSVRAHISDSVAPDCEHVTFEDEPAT